MTRRAMAWCGAVGWLGLAGCVEPTAHESPTVAARLAAEEPEAATPPRRARGQDSDAVRYTIRLEAPHTHMMHVEATWRPASSEPTTWMLPVWTPGSYKVREYARHVEGVRAVGPGGEPLRVVKTRKNRWQVEGASGPITLQYAVYGREMSVRANYIDADFASVVGAATFVTPVNALSGPYEVRVAVPDGWRRVESTMTRLPDARIATFRAEDFDELVDSPLIAGNPEVHRFDVGGVPHRLVNVGGEGVWDEARSAEGVERVVQVVSDFWGDIPYDTYTFFNVVGTGRGGLEHRDGTLMMADRLATSDDAAFENWLGLVAHEFFHTWNVKRLRPAALGPFDYETEVYTPSLWIAEGITSYYDDLLLARAGLIDADEHLARLSHAIEALQSRPGRFVQPLSTASFDAWIKHYMPDENSVNTSVSYYRKGALVGFLLDAEIRRATANRRSLDDVMRRAYERFGESDGYTESQFRQVASDVAGIDLASWFEAAVDGTVELDFGPALAWYGLRFTSSDTDDDAVRFGADIQGTPFHVTQVHRDGSAWNAGVIVGDEILAVDGLRVDAGRWSSVLQRYSPRDTVDVLVSRHGRVRTVSVELDAAPVATWKLEVSPVATTAARQRRRSWHGPRHAQVAAHGHDEPSGT